MTLTRIVRPITLLLARRGTHERPRQGSVRVPSTAGPIGQLPTVPPCPVILPPTTSAARARYSGLPRGAQTVTDFRPLIRAMTSLPGWNHAPDRPRNIQPAFCLPSA